MVTVLDQTEAGVQNRKFEGGDPDFNVRTRLVESLCCGPGFYMPYAQLAIVEKKVRIVMEILSLGGTL